MVISHKADIKQRDREMCIEQVHRYRSCPNHSILSRNMSKMTTLDQQVIVKITWEPGGNLHSYILGIEGIGHYPWAASWFCSWLAGEDGEVRSARSGSSRLGGEIMVVIVCSHIAISRQLHANRWEDAHTMDAVLDIIMLGGNFIRTDWLWLRPWLSPVTAVTVGQAGIPWLQKWGLRHVTCVSVPCKPERC